jgi:hypothetical protein
MPVRRSRYPYRGIAPLLPAGSMSAREYEQWRDEHTWDPARQHGLVIQTDLKPADWIEPALPDQESSAPMLLPSGFDAYTRIFIPHFEETAGERHERIAEALTEPMPGADQDDQAAYCGFLPSDQFGALLPILARFTGSATSWFLLWDGFGTLNERAFSRAPKVRHPLRDLYLLRGPHAAHGDFREDPSYWWPDDRAWCVCADTDWDYYYVAGTLACIEDILRACDRA